MFIKMTDLENVGKKLQKQITRLWLSGDGYSTCIIPKQMASECGLSRPCYIIIEKSLDGILIRKLNIKEETI